MGSRVANVRHISAFKEDCICYACVAPLRFNGNRSRVNISPHCAPFSAVAGSERVWNLVGLSECSHLLRKEEPCTIRSTCVCGIFGQCQKSRQRTQPEMQMERSPAGRGHTAHFPPARPCPLCHAMLHEIRPLTSPGTLSLLLSSVPRSSRCAA